MSALSSCRRCYPQTRRLANRGFAELHLLCDKTVMTIRDPRPDIMAMLLDEAAAAAAAGEVPVAAAVTDAEGAVIALAQNRMRRDGNALHHAEMLVLADALALRGSERLCAGFAPLPRTPAVTVLWHCLSVLRTCSADNVPVRCSVRNEKNARAMRCTL